MNELKTAASLLGSKGGKSTLKNKGVEHFRAIGKKSAERKKALKLAEKLSTSVDIDTTAC